jgi:amidohydrolase
MTVIAHCTNLVENWISKQGTNMNIASTRQGLFAELRAFRRDVHANPEFGFEETRTARAVTAVLRAIGLEVTTNVGGTGVVATLRRGTGLKAILLRADMDALRICEAPAADRAHVSKNDGLMHACGHDGHTAILLGAAHNLAEQGGFDGTVHFVFQPAEEWGKGMLAMLEDGLLQRFPASEAYALHNMPNIPLGKFETRPGVFKAAEDNFTITIHGKSGHSARPHWGRDALVAAAAVITALQTIVSRVIEPGQQAVVTCTDIKVDATRNVTCGRAVISGDCRTLNPEVSVLIESEMRRISENIAQAHGCFSEIEYSREFVPTVNDENLTREVLSIIEGEFGEGAVEVAARPNAGSEDFGQLLRLIPGCFVNIGNGPSAPLHNPNYDFNDDAIRYGVDYFVAVVKARLPCG